MLDFSNFDIQPILGFFSAHPYVAYAATFVIVFIEATALVGMVIPGVITMPMIGFLIGSNIIPVGTTFMYAIAGAICGDCLSYFLGIYFQKRVHKIWPFTKWPKLLEQSEKFFRKHGGKSVFIGRFIGLARTMIPLVAGMFKMPLLRFLLAAIPSVTLWAICYILPGILLGALSLELPPKIAAKFTFYSFLAIVALWFAVWLIQHYFKQIWKMVDYYIMHAWKYCQKSRISSWLTKLLSDPKEPDNHLQLMLLIMAALTAILFFVTLYQTLAGGILSGLSYAIYHLLTSLRSTSIDYIFILFTLLGDIQFLVIASGIVLLWLLWQRQWYLAFHGLIIGVVSILVISVIRFFIYSPRPGDILYYIHSSSFPSAHAVLSVVCYGFLAMIIARESKKKKRYLPYVAAGILIGIIAFSRIYLGAHWLLDVLGGILLGLLIVLLATVSYRRRHILHFHVRDFILVVSTVFVAVWLGYGVFAFNQQKNDYTLIWPQPVVTFKNFINHPETIIPLYRLNRLGRPIEALNVIYIGKLETLSKTLEKNGWESQPVSLDFQNLIKGFVATSIVNHLTIFPQLYHNKRMALLFTKSIDQNGDTSILRLWPSDVDLKDSDFPLWVGSIEYHHAVPSIFSLKRLKNKRLFMGATEFLAKNLTKDFSLWRKNYKFSQQPFAMRELQWDGKILVIREKNRQ